MNTLSTRQDLVCFPRVKAKFEVPELKAEFWNSGKVLVTVGTFGTDVACGRIEWPL